MSSASRLLIFLSVSLSCFFPATGVAQLPEMNPAFRSFTLEDGLSQFTVYCVFRILKVIYGWGHGTG